jgi:Leucine-rich repeat (LRR) protein
LFDNFTKKINLDFISAGWIFFTIGGFFLMYGFFYHKNIKVISNKDAMASNSLFPESSNETNTFLSFLSIDNEKLSGIILLGLLNLLLLTVNLLDINFLWFDGTLPKDLSYSAFVHQGTGALITSIIIAILIILFYFRGALNFHSGNKSLKLLACLWIAQNAFMIISTAFRNNLYINEYSLTYKRIGVYVWLILVFIGLVTTFVKIIKTKSNWYLFRTNGWLFYFVLVFSCVINWDVLVTNFNITKAEQKHRPMDTYYLVSLSERNIPQLFALNDSIKSQATTDDDNYETRSDLYRTPVYQFSYNYKPALNYKLYRFLDDVQKSEWQSACFEKKRVYEAVQGFKQNIKEIDLQNYYLQTLKPLETLENVKSLYFSNNHLKDLKELKMFPLLENLYLNSNQFDSLDSFPAMDHLKFLSLSSNVIKNGKPLENAPNLISLDLSNNQLLDLNTLPVLKKLNSLSLNNILNVADYAPLLKFPNLFELNLSGAILHKKNILPVLSKLVRLNLQSNDLWAADTALFERLGLYGSLEYLNLSDNKLESLYPITSYFNLQKSVAKGESILPLYKSLKSLYVARNSIQTLYPLIAYPNLEELDISGNLLRELTPLSQMSNLKTLQMDNCGITTIDFVKKLKNLEVLSLSDNNIKDYSPVYELKNLKQLNIGTVTEQVVERLKKELPNTLINATVIK